MFKICKFIEFLHILILNVVILRCSSTTIDIPQGKIKGISNDSIGYTAYLGIPYATVTERFQEPGSPPQWNGTYHAVKPVNCEQTVPSTKKPTGQQDCLVLNVFKPINVTEQPLPVLIVIPGGGFHFSLNIYDMYDPKYLVKKDIIVITINYRLGAFGFLCLQTPELPGNLGFKDQVAAIRWVKNNIQYFGGDPESITLYGQSVGGTSVSYLLLSPETEGLFQHVIIASGSVLVPYALDNDPVGTASRIASRMGYETNDTAELLKIYQNASSDDILNASFFNDTNDPLSLYVFRPCVDDSEGSLVKASPSELITSTSVNKNVSVVIGCNNMEGIKWAERFNSEGLQNLEETFSKIIPYNLIFATDEEKSTFVAEVKDFYFKNQTIDSYEPLVDYFTDSIIMYPVVATAKRFLCANKNMYNYYFQYDSNRNIYKINTILGYMKGASHSDDLEYAYDPSSLHSIPLIPNDAAMIDAITSFWSNVAKTGNPATEDISWTASDDDLKFLSINTTMEMISLPNKERMQFWQEIYEKYNHY